jgi:hypothetical protein
MGYDASAGVNAKLAIWRLNTPSYIVLAADAGNSTTTLANITGLLFTAAANATYEIELIGAFQSAAIITGIAVALDIPDGSIIGINTANISTTVLGDTFQRADNAVAGNGSPSVDAANNNVLITGRWIYVSGAGGGTVQARLRSEVASSNVTIKANLTVLKVTRIK